MRDVILCMSMSLDGFVGGGREHPGMAIPGGAEVRQGKPDRISKAGVRLMGRVTYQEMSSYWPHSDDPYAAPVNDIPTVVFSRPLSGAGATWPGTRVVRGELAAEIAAIRAGPGPGVIIWGGGRLAGAPAAQDLIDGYRLLVQPLVLGSGQALSGQLPQSGDLHLAGTMSFPGGFAGHLCRPQHS